jgi:alpha-aminoadipate carrier protein LysW
MTADCPECAAAVPLEDNVEVSEIVTCPDCGADLEVAEVAPVRLTLAPPEEEDWGE